MKGNGIFGKWITDPQGLPAYLYTCDQYSEPKAITPTTYGNSIDHFHQIGNDRIMATAHNGGHLQVLDSSRGFQWLTYRDLSKKRFKLGGGIALFDIDESGQFYADLYTPEVTQIGLDYERIFGMGYFQKRIEGPGVVLKHTICAPFSDDPVFIADIELTNTTDTIKRYRIINFWDVYLRHITKSLVVTWKNRKLYGVNKLINGAGRFIKFFQKLVGMDTDKSRTKFDKKFDFLSDINGNKLTITPIYKKRLPSAKDQPAKHNYYPNSMFLAILNKPALKFFVEQESLVSGNRFKVNWDAGINSSIQEALNNPCLGIGTSIEANPGGTIKVTFLFGYADINDIDELIKKYEDVCNKEDILYWNARQWNESLIDLKIPDKDWLSREIKWHSYYTRSSSYFDEYFSNHVFPQGSIYQFGHGLDGAIRDYVLYLKAIIFLDKRLAKEYLSYILSLMSPNGKLPYSRYGFAKFFTGSVHSKPSDLYLFLIWGILQYVYTTRDFKFLEQQIQFYPKSDNHESTVLERIQIALKYLLSEEVGIGEHGLIKCNDGDWSDGISLMVKKRKKFIQRGESAFNSTFALYIIPKLYPLLKRHDITAFEQCKNLFEDLEQAVLKSRNNKWFFRGWDGIGNPIGDKNIYLEHHTWLLLSGILDEKQANILIESIYTNLDKPSPFGQYISYPPENVKLSILPKGWDVNGGIWHAINALLTWGYSKYDPEKAYNSLIKNSMAQRAEIYPNIWYGIWSGPDAYIADYAKNAGQAFYHLTTPMCDFPLMNLNIHACYLLSVIKMMGFEANYDSVIIDPKITSKDFKFHSPILSVEANTDSLTLKYKPIKLKNMKLVITKPTWWNDNSCIHLNGSDITNSNNQVLKKDNQIILIIIEELNMVELRLSLNNDFQN